MTLQRGSFFRVTSPPNLDLILQSLVRKILRDQPNSENLYSFAADYFEKLVTIRDRIESIPHPTENDLPPDLSQAECNEFLKLIVVFPKPDFAFNGKFNFSTGGSADGDDETVKAHTDDLIISNIEDNDVEEKEANAGKICKSAEETVGNLEERKEQQSLNDEEDQREKESVQNQVGENLEIKDHTIEGVPPKESDDADEVGPLVENVEEQKVDTIHAENDVKEVLHIDLKTVNDQEDEKEDIVIEGKDGESEDGKIDGEAVEGIKDSVETSESIEPHDDSIGKSNDDFEEKIAQETEGESLEENNLNVENDEKSDRSQNLIEEESGGANLIKEFVEKEYDVIKSFIEHEKEHSSSYKMKDEETAVIKELDNILENAVETASNRLELNDLGEEIVVVADVITSEGGELIDSLDPQTDVNNESETIPDISNSKETFPEEPKVEHEIAKGESEETALDTCAATVDNLNEEELVKPEIETESPHNGSLVKDPLEAGDNNLKSVDHSVEFNASESLNLNCEDAEENEINDEKEDQTVAESSSSGLLTKEEQTSDLLIDVSKEEPMEESMKLNHSRSSKEMESLEEVNPFISVEVKTAVQDQSNTLEENPDEKVEERFEFLKLVKAAEIIQRGFRAYKKRRNANHGLVEVEEVTAAQEEKTAEEVVNMTDENEKDVQSSTEENCSELISDSTSTSLSNVEETSNNVGGARIRRSSTMRHFPEKAPTPDTKRSQSLTHREGIDHEVWNTIEKELQTAASKIQQGYRTYRARKQQLRRENAVQIRSTTSEDSNSSPKSSRLLSTGEFHDTIVLD